MANRYLLGFEDLDTAGISYESPQFAGTVAVSALAVRTASKGLRISAGGSARYAHFVACPEGQQTITFGFSWRSAGWSSSVEAIAMFSGWTATHLMLAITASGNLRWYRYDAPQYTLSVQATSTQLGGTGVTNLQLNTWYWISGKITIDNTTGAIETYINDVEESALMLTGQDTRNSNAGDSVIVSVGFTAHVGSGTDAMDIDGLVVNDMSGADAGPGGYGIPVDGRVDCHMPDADGLHSEWTRSVGSDQFFPVSEVDPDGDSTYNETPTLDAKDLLNIENFQNPGATIFAVQVDAITRKTTVGACRIAPLMRIDGVTYLGDDKSPGEEYSKQRQSYPRQPDGTAWNEVDFNAMQVGYQKTV